MKIEIELEEFENYFASASEIQRQYKLSISTVRKACKAGWIRAWQLGRDYVIYRPDAEARWGGRKNTPSEVGGGILPA